MAEEQAVADAPQQAAKSGGGGMLPALLVIVLMPVISFAMFKFLFIPMIKAEIPEQGEETPITAEDLDIAIDDSGSEHKYIFDPIVANIRGTSLTRFVQADVTIYSVNPELETLIGEKIDRLKDQANTVLGELTLADFERRGNKNIVRNQLKQGFNHILGKPVVEDIALTLVIQ